MSRREWLARSAAHAAGRAAGKATWSARRQGHQVAGHRAECCVGDEVAAEAFTGDLGVFYDGQ
eukprot:3416133-Pyramimonas_sp.AAC.1